MPRNTSSGADRFHAVATMMQDVTFAPVTKHQNTSLQRKRFAAVHLSLLRLCLAKTLHNRRINDLEEHLPGALFAMIL